MKSFAASFGGPLDGPTMQIVVYRFSFQYIHNICLISFITLILIVWFVRRVALRGKGIPAGELFAQMHNNLPNIYFSISTNIQKAAVHFKYLTLNDLKHFVLYEIDS